MKGLGMIISMPSTGFTFVIRGLEAPYASPCHLRASATLPNLN